MSTLYSKRQLFACDINNIKNTSKDITYIVKGLIGGGKFSKVYCALAPDNEYYAIKAIDWKDDISLEDHIETCKSEIDIHSHLNHPNICKYIDSFKGNNNTYYIVMELCKSETLATVIKNRGWVTEEEARYWMLQLLDVISYLQSQNVIHRDLKPSNILLGEDMSIKLTDFGLSSKIRSIGELTRKYCGTCEYMAPEVIKDEGYRYSYEIDIWSFAIILFELVTGIVPFQGANNKKTLKLICQEEWGFPGYIVDDLSQEVKDCITRLIIHNPIYRLSIEPITQLRFFKLPKPDKLPKSAIYKDPNFTNTSQSSQASYGNKRNISQISEYSSSTSTSTSDSNFISLDLFPKGSIYSASKIDPRSFSEPKSTD